VGRHRLRGWEQQVVERPDFAALGIIHRGGVNTSRVSRVPGDEAPLVGLEVVREVVLREAVDVVEDHLADLIPVNISSSVRSWKSPRSGRRARVLVHVIDEELDVREVAALVGLLFPVIAVILASRLFRDAHGKPAVVRRLLAL
jgi:hypothetical protein